jgi:predicted TIM-barrel fold metal-dependent hydrolase
VQITVDDPELYTKPFTVKVTKILLPDSDVLETVCNENEKDRAGAFMSNSHLLETPLLLEEVLVKHQRLRLYVMHAGWPRLESMIALLSVHPGVYVDVAALQSEAVMPRPAYYRYLRGLVESGFAKCIMFGSGFPDQAGAGY